MTDLVTIQESASLMLLGGLSAVGAVLALLGVVWCVLGLVRIRRETR